MEKEAVANTSSLLFLAKLDKFELLKNMFSKIFVPKQVIEEITEKNNPENAVIRKELGQFIHEAQLKEVKDFNLGKGEKAAISLCLEKNIRHFVSDDKKARRSARSLSIETIGVLGLVLYNLEHDKIKKEEAKDLIDELISNGYFMSSVLYSKVMRLINS